jgi:polyisoprenoid-binding protein YceI
MEGRSAPLTLGILLCAATPSIAQRMPEALEVDVAASHIYVITYRTGLLKFLGHEHAIVAPRFTSQLCWDDAHHAATRAAFVVDARALEIDSDSGRVLAGLGKGPSASQRAQIERKLHDEDHLATGRYPELRFETTSVAQDGAGKLKLRGRLTIKGSTRDVELPITYQERGAGDLWLTGSLELRQSAFGIRPESIAGVVKVADPVTLRVGLLAKRSQRGC